MVTPPSTMRSPTEPGLCLLAPRSATPRANTGSRAAREPTGHARSRRSRVRRPRLPLRQFLGPRPNIRVVCRRPATPQARTGVAPIRPLRESPGCELAHMPR
jgi:hypothetical protein